MTIQGLREDHLTLPGAQFDCFAAGYTAGMEDPLKALLGVSADEYIDLKLRWMLRRFPLLSTADAATRLLDYGCGTAALLRLMAEAKIKATLAGCDVSPRMLEEAERLWPERLWATKPTLHLQQGSATPFRDGEFDFVVISAVLHHVPVPHRPQVYAEVCRVARPGAQIVVFEHNPLNPVTRLVVSRTAIDRDAILLRAREVACGLASAGAIDICRRYIMFTPPRLRFPDVLEAKLGWLPLGAQFVVTATAHSNTARE